MTSAHRFRKRVDGLDGANPQRESEGAEVNRSPGVEAALR